LNPCGNFGFKQLERFFISVLITLQVSKISTITYKSVSNAIFSKNIASVNSPRLSEFPQMIVINEVNYISKHNYGFWFDILVGKSVIFELLSNCSDLISEVSKLFYILIFLIQKVLQSNSSFQNDTMLFKILLF